ncbi:MAG: hypothetical protein WB588_02485 [Dehalococcoidia bacterium]
MKKGIAALISLFLLAFLLPLAACEPASANNFGVLTFNVTPDKVIENEKFTATATITNASRSKATYIVPVMVNGIADDRTEVTLAPGELQEIQFTLHRGTAGIYEIRIGDKSSTVNVDKIAPASFEVSDLKLNMEVANPGEEVIITARVTNTGGSEGTYISELKINGVTEQSDKAVIPPGSGYNAAFKVIKTEPGTYIVGIGDLSDNYTVQQPIETIQVTTPAPAAQDRISHWQKSSGSCCGGGVCP